MRKYLVAAVMMVAVAGCQNKKKQQTDTSALNPPAAPPVAYVPPSAPPEQVAPAPVDNTVVDTTPAPAEPVAKSAKSSKGSKSAGHITGHTYIVKSGDTLSKIARARYGTLSKVKAIEAANPGLNPDKLQVGQKINLP